jgi:hypothetical protein
MEDGQDPSSYREEHRGLNTSVGNDETNFVWHEENIEPFELVETITNLMMKVQIYRIDNERMLRAHERKNQINTLLMQSLNKLQRKTKNGTNSSQEEEEKSYLDRRCDGIFMIWIV